MNNKRVWAIIKFDDRIFSRGRIVHKSSYREKYADELKKCLRKNGVGFKPSQDAVLLKETFPGVVGAIRRGLDRKSV